jgi:hypothetical protein
MELWNVPPTPCAARPGQLAFTSAHSIPSANRTTPFVTTSVAPVHFIPPVVHDVLMVAPSARQIVPSAPPPAPFTVSSTPTVPSNDPLTSSTSASSDYYYSDSEIGDVDAELARTWGMNLHDTGFQSSNDADESTNKLDAFANGQPSEVVGSSNKETSPSGLSRKSRTSKSPR